METKNSLYLGEYWDVEENTKKLRVMKQSPYRHGMLSPVITNTTTALFAWGGAVKVSQFLNIAESSEKERDALGEGIFPSNTAVLVFPAVLGALAPSSFFEMMGKLSFQIVYAIATGVISVLPLAIKGVEMVAFTKEIRTGCVTWNVGGEIKSGQAITKLWRASCKHHSIFRTYGYGFLIASISLMLTGFPIELLAYRWVWRRRKRLEMHSNMRIDRFWFHGTCTECNCVSSVMTTGDESSRSVSSNYWT